MIPIRNGMGDPSYSIKGESNAYSVKNDIKHNRSLYQWLDANKEIQLVHSFS